MGGFLRNDRVKKEQKGGGISEVLIGKGGLNRHYLGTDLLLDGLMAQGRILPKFKVTKGTLKGIGL